MQPTDKLKRPQIFWGLVLCGLCVLLAIIVHARLLQHLDLQITLFLQSILPRSLDLPSSILSLLGSAEATVLVLAPLVILSQPAIRVRLIFLFLLLSLLEVLGKTMIDQPQPPDELLRYVFSFGTPTGGLSTAFSYPSGHAARTSFLAALAIALVARSHTRPATKRILTVLVLVAAAVMLISRVYIGDHWTSDVIGGVLLGVGLFLFACLTDSEHESRIESTERSDHERVST